MSKISPPIWIAMIIIGYVSFIVAMNVFYPTNINNLDWEDRQSLNQQHIAHLELGQAKKNILENMGTPDFIQSFVAEQNSIEVLFYRTHHVTSDGETTKDECTPLLFKNGQLEAIGNQALEHFTQALQQVN
ncbi:DUF3192 domain-containing protein [Paraferrimonas sp. SM1919]|uniref:DUF3192 domain-containing protein n=1 Tax=Paraferrimonas sp. SM1919 TaxID=2662263 RepID=UPI0013D718F3|nr:DUF3192 domain-containing protein [Paraferrimonas sp. SM1919]